MPLSIIVIIAVHPFGCGRWQGENDGRTNPVTRCHLRRAVPAVLAVGREYFRHGSRAAVSGSSVRPIYMDHRLHQARVKQSCRTSADCVPAYYGTMGRPPAR